MTLNARNMLLTPFYTIAFSGAHSLNINEVRSMLSAARR